MVDRVAVWDQEIFKPESLAGTSLFRTEEGSSNSVMDCHKGSMAISFDSPELSCQSQLQTYPSGSYDSLIPGKNGAKKDAGI